MKNIPNPTGKGGFGDNPQNRNNGTWSKETSMSYWQNYLLRLSKDDFEKFEPQSMAAILAYEGVKNSMSELIERKEIQDRTEGKAQQAIDHTTDGEKIQVSDPFAQMRLNAGINGQTKESD